MLSRPGISRKLEVSAKLGLGLRRSLGHFSTELADDLADIAVHGIIDRLAHVQGISLE